MAQPESRLRARCRMLLDAYLVAPCWYSAIEHGRKHAGTEKQRAAQWQRLAAQGVKSGLGDILILIPNRAIWIELKAGANKQSTMQITLQADMTAVGHGYAVVRSVSALVDACNWLEIPLHHGAALAAEMHDMSLSVPVKAPKATTSKPRTARPTKRQVATGNRMSLAMVRGG